MTRRRQRNNGGKKTRSVRGGELTQNLKQTVNTDINTLLSQYFSGENLDQTLIAKYASNIELKEFTPIYKNYSSISQTPNYLNALAKYGNIRSAELDVISFSSSLNAVTTAFGVASMGLIVSMQAAAFAGNAGVVATIGTATAGTISSATTSVITAIGGATALGLTATGLGLIVLFGLVSTMVYVSNLYLKEKELQELSRLIVGVCEYIKNDAHIIHMFYKNTNTALPPGAKLGGLLKQLYNLMFKTLSYFPKEYFFNAYKNYLNTENVAVRIAELNQVYNVYNTTENYLNCNEQNIDILLQTGNFLLYRYIFVRLCIIDEQKYMVDYKKPQQSQSGGVIFEAENFATSDLGQKLRSMTNNASNVASSIREGIGNFGNKISTNETINKIRTGISTGAKTIASPITGSYSRYRKFFRPIAEVEREYNVSITNHIPSKPFIEQTVSATANSSFLYSGEQFRQLLGDYAIMDTTYTMSVTKYVFDFNTYVIKNMGTDKLQSAVPSNVTDANQILDAVVGTNNSESETTTQLKQKIAVMLYPLLAEKVYNDIFGKVQLNSATIKNIESFVNRNNEDKYNEESDSTSITMPSTPITMPSTPNTTPRSPSKIDLSNNE